MTAETQKNLWRLGYIAVIAVVIWKIWPWLKEKLSGSSSGGSSGAAGVSSPYPYSENPYSQQGSGSGLQIGGGSGAGNPSYVSAAGGGAISQLFSDIAQGVQNALGMSTQLGYNPTTHQDELAALDQQGLPLEPIQNLTNLQSWSADDPNAPWNTSTDLQDYAQTISVDAGDTVDAGSYIDYGGGGADTVEQDWNESD